MSEASRDEIAAARDEVYAEATRLAGGVDDLAQRAAVYHHLWRHSGGNHAFPLLAAHGALWGAGHFRRGAILGHLFSIAAPDRAERRAQVARFATALKDINRQVCVETYASYHLTRRFGEDAAVVAGARATEHLCRCHAARRAGKDLSAEERRALFSSFFLWEQDAIVGPGVDAAVARLDWPLIRALALRPPIGFSYFGPVRWLWFRAFDDKAERIRKGLAAFDLAEARGWATVEARLGTYARYPDVAAHDPDGYFERIAETLGTASHMRVVGESASA